MKRNTNTVRERKRTKTTSMVSPLTNLPNAIVTKNHHYIKKIYNLLLSKKIIEACLRLRFDDNTRIWVLEIKLLLSGQKLPVTRQQLVRFGDDIICKLVDFILLSSNDVVPNLYCIKWIKLAHVEFIVQPRLQSKNERIKIYDSCKEASTLTDQQSFSKETFYRIINSIIAYEQVVLSAIGYITSMYAVKYCKM